MKLKSCKIRHLSTYLFYLLARVKKNVLNLEWILFFFFSLRWNRTILLVIKCKYLWIILRSKYVHCALFLKLKFTLANKFYHRIKAVCYTRVIAQKKSCVFPVHVISCSKYIAILPTTGHCISIIWTYFQTWNDLTII